MRRHFHFNLKRKLLKLKIIPLYNKNSEFALPAVQMSCVDLHNRVDRYWSLINRIRYTVTLSYRWVSSACQTGTTNLDKSFPILEIKDNIPEKI